MKLSRFISARLEDILAEWEAFARTQQPQGAHMSPLALRNHAKQILQAIALDIDTAQTPSEQDLKSKGLAAPLAAAETAASTHGTLRQLSGFSLVQLNAEFRAMRATVLRLWLPTVKELDEASTRDMIRFNETIDQALAESIVTYTDRSSRSRDTFLAILGHDLRSPLSTMAMAGEYLALRGLDETQTREVGARVRRSAATMTAMVNDLLEYARSQLGGNLPIRPRRARSAAGHWKTWRSRIRIAGSSSPWRATCTAASTATACSSCSRTCSTTPCNTAGPASRSTCAPRAPRPTWC